MDISENYVPYFLLVGLVFILFFFLLSIFGYFFLFCIKKHMNTKEDESSISVLEQLFVSFGIGLSTYLSFSYLLDLFALFNFFTAYLSIIIFDSLFVIYYYYIKNNELKNPINKEKFRIWYKNFSSNKNNIFNLGVLISTITIIFIIQWIIITEATSLNYTDPFKWYETTFYLVDNGHIDYYHLDYNYPSGHSFFNAGVLLIYPDYLFGYYYFKFIPLYFISLYVIIAFLIVKKLFKQKYLIVLSMLFLLTSRYFLSRTLLYLASSLASGLLIISLIVIINKYPDYVMGIFLAGLYLIHNLTTFYYMFVLLIFFLYRLIISIRNREILLDYIKSLLYSIIVAFILLIPYLLSIYYIYGNTIFDFLYHFLERFEEADYAYLLHDSKKLYNSVIKLVFPLEYFEPIIDINLLELLDELFERSIYLFFIFPCIGLFIYLKEKENVRDEEILIFFKIFIIIILFFFFIPHFVDSFNFFIKFRKRILQSFNLPIIIMALYTVEWIVNKSKKFTNFLARKSKFYKNLIERNKIYSKLFKIESTIIIIILASTSSSFIIHRYPDYYYYYEDELVEVVLYLRNHAEPNSKILREDFDSAVIFRMLYDMKIKKYNVNETSSYEDLRTEIHERDIDYLIFSKDFFDNKTIEDSLCDSARFKVLLENDEYILFKYKR